MSFAIRIEAPKGFHMEDFKEHHEIMKDMISSHRFLSAGRIFLVYL